MSMTYNDQIILIDVDGVLLNWDAALHRWINQILAVPNSSFTATDVPLREAMYDISKRYDIQPDNADLITTAFNHSLYINNLAPIPDAIKYVRELYQLGYQLHAITAIGDNPMVREARRHNLHNVFGREVFAGIDFVGTSESKLRYLEQYRDTKCFWIEDHVKNAILGSEIGLQSILFARSHNLEEWINLPGPDAKKIKYCSNWKAVYKHITEHPH